MKFYDAVNDKLLKFTVIISQSMANGCTKKEILIKCREHREVGENIFETAKREFRKTLNLK